MLVVILFLCSKTHLFRGAKVTIFLHNSRFLLLRIIDGFRTPRELLDLSAESLVKSSVKMLATFRATSSLISLKS
ncbi:hypothetical protein HQ36_02575 [Porphyromonas gingivicanis]|uniref:Uncharacterized protein n=1 Tax=Porphyromonas gingivicanis TaxID=266762 RepID=A0A0A2G516_9PORP|nr:hypothetical protein [Porphyromonas gingivicanis]KGN98321.1 hypothetical protein HQ36_02575 [Porphyromonas gingivicanis]